MGRGVAEEVRRHADRHDYLPPNWVAAEPPTLFFAMSRIARSLFCQANQERFLFQVELTAPPKEGGSHLSFRWQRSHSSGTGGMTADTTPNCPFAFATSSGSRRECSARPPWPSRSPDTRGPGHSPRR